MKKAGLLLVLLLILTGCGSSKVPQIEDYTWVMTSVQSVEAGGQAVAYGERGSSTLETAKQIVLLCRAEEGSMTLIDQTNHKTYTGTYQLSKDSPQGAIYEVTIEGQEGYAATAMTTYQDGSQDPTLIFNLGDYAVNFFAE